MPARNRNDSAQCPIFLSYADPDVLFAQQLADWIETHIKVKCFLAPITLTSGAIWPKEILKAVRNCTLGIVVVTSQSIHRDWVQYELGALAALGKSIIPIRLAEHGVKPLILKTLNAAHCNDWSTDTARAVVREIVDILKKKKKLPEDFKLTDYPNFGFSTLKRAASDDQFLKMLRDSMDYGIHRAYEEGIEWKDHDLAPVFKDEIIPRFKSAIHDAIEKRRIELPFRDRMKVARQIIREARRSIVAISIMGSDEWLFPKRPDSSEYLRDNLTAAKRIGKNKVQRLIVFDDPAILDDRRETLTLMAANGIQLHQISRAAFDECNRTQFDRLIENLLIVDSHRMTESNDKDTSRSGWYSTSRDAILEMRNQFDLLWQQADPYLPGGTT